MLAAISLESSSIRGEQGEVSLRLSLMNIFSLASAGFSGMIVFVIS